MLFGVQRFEVPAIGIQRTSWSIDAPGLWIRLVHQAGMGSDESFVRLLGYGRPLGSRNLVGACLDGYGVVRTAGGRVHTYRPGDLSLVPGRAAYSGRIEADDPASFSLTIEIDRATWGGAPYEVEIARAHDPASIRAAAIALTREIEETWTDPRARRRAEGVLLDLFARLRAEGVALPAIDPRALPAPPEQIRALSRAIDRSLSQTDARAMLVDLEDAASARTLQRALPTLCAIWGQSVESFRAHTRRTILARASWAMTNARATTEAIARAVGFSTPNAFCRAMATFGLPSPGRMRDRFLAAA